MTIDEAINNIKSDIKYNKSIGCDISYEEQLVEWLEELKAIKSDGFTDDLLKMGFKKGYSNAIDDFVKFANTMPTVEEEDGTIRPMWLEEMAEKLKAVGNADLLIDRAKSKSGERIPYDGKWK